MYINVLQAHSLDLAFRSRCSAASATWPGRLQPCCPCLACKLCHLLCLANRASSDAAKKVPLKFWIDHRSGQQSQSRSLSRFRFEPVLEVIMKPSNNPLSWQTHPFISSSNGVNSIWGRAQVLFACTRVCVVESVEFDPMFGEVELDIITNALVLLCRMRYMSISLPRLVVRTLKALPSTRLSAFSVETTHLLHA